MTREEYVAIELPEAEITLHSDPEEGVTYVEVKWETPLARKGYSDVHGFKFIVADEILLSWKPPPSS